MEREAEENLTAAAKLIRSYGAVAIVGAGISVEAGYPLLTHFEPLLRNSLLQDVDCREDLGQEFNDFVEGTQSVLDIQQQKSIYAAISRHPKARSALQHAFARRDLEQTEHGGIGYMAELARLLHSRSIVAVISLNWDTQLEAAYEQTFGRRFEADGDWLIKPHGDARKPNEPWVLPFEPSNLSQDILENIRVLAEGVRVLLMIGYSGQDEEIVSNIIDPLSDQWKVVRVGPGLRTPDINMTASEAIPRLRNLVCGDQQNGDWEYVRFIATSGLAHALSGRGLLPGDAQECPSVPEVDRVVRELRTNRSAYLLGDSGSGKSAIAYQVALQFSREGWEVVRLLPGGSGGIYAFPHPTLAIVDDAQARSSAEIRSMYESASERCAVLVVSDQKILGIDATVEVAAKRSVSHLAAWMRENIERVKPLVKSLDKDIGDGYFNTSLEQRIDRAELEADRPWTFNFILTGGWRRAQEDMATLKEAYDADLILFAIAAGQLATSDNGLREEELLGILENAGVAGSDCSSGLQKLKFRKLVFQSPRLKCPHRDFAGVVIQYISNRDDDSRWEKVEKIIEEVFRSNERKMLGCNSLLFKLNFSNGFRSHRRRTALSQGTKRWFSQSIWHATSPEEVRNGLLVLEHLKGWWPDYENQIEINLHLIAQYIETVDGITAHAVANFINWFSQDRRLSHLYLRLFQLISPKRVAQRFEQVSYSNAYAFGDLAGRLSNCAPKPWIKEWRRHLPWTYFEGLIEDVKDHSVYALAELVRDLVCSNNRKWSKLFWKLAPKLANCINENPLKATRSFDPGFWYLLDYPPLAKFWNLIEPASIGNAYANGTPREWHMLEQPLISIYNAKRLRALDISRNVDFNRLLSSSIRSSDQGNDALISTLFDLATFSDRKPVLTWLRDKGQLFESASRELATLLPARASELILSGKKIDLRMDGGFWGAVLTVECLKHLVRVDAEAACVAIRQNTDNLGNALMLHPDAHDTGGIADLIMLSIELVPQTVLETVNALDKLKLAENWRNILQKGDNKLRSAVTDLSQLASSSFDQL